MFSFVAISSKFRRVFFHFFSPPEMLLLSERRLESLRMSPARIFFFVFADIEFSCDSSFGFFLPLSAYERGLIRWNVKKGAAIILIHWDLFRISLKSRH